jgi:hypothetical protein
MNTKKFEHLYRYCDKDLNGLFLDAQEGRAACLSPTLALSVTNTHSNIKSKEGLKPFADFFNVFKQYFGNQITSQDIGKGGKYTKPKDLNWLNKQMDNGKERELKKKNLIGYSIGRIGYGCSAGTLTVGYGIAQPPAFRSLIDVDFGCAIIKMRMDLPVDLLESNSKEYFQKLLYDLFNDYPIDIGYIGYSFLFDYSLAYGLSYYVNWRELYFENKCFLPSKPFELPVIHNVPVIVGWITLVGDQHLQQLGGRVAAQKFFSKDKEIIIHEFKYGIGIQIGKQPIAGTQDEDISLYKKVTQFLLPFRTQREPYLIFGISQKKYDAEKKEWISIYPNRGDEKWKADNNKWYTRFDN